MPLKDEAGRRAAAFQEKYGVAPGLAVIIVGEDPASEVYVRNKDKAWLRKVGIYSVKLSPCPRIRRRTN